MLTKTEVTNYTIPISEVLSLRLYSDTRPHHQHIANLQKGGILVYRGAELVGEGTGFGVPVLRYRDKTYFSGSSTLRIFQKDNCTKAIKQFALNIVFERRCGKVKLENKMMHKFTSFLDELYLKHRHWRMLPLTLASLSKSIGVQTSFVRVKPRGKVDVIYHVDPPHIHVKADFKSLGKNSLQKIFMLNEQGSEHFRKYYDSNGTVLLDKQIGAWEKVEADWACITNKNDEIGFRLWKVKDTILHRGREFLEDTLDWVGLDYEVSPEKTCFEYYVEIVGKQEQK